MSLTDDINSIIGSAKAVVNTVNAEVSELNNNLLSLTAAPLINHRLNYAGIGSISPSSFTPGVTSVPVNLPTFTGTIPTAPALEPINVPINVTPHLIGAAPDIDTNIDAEDIDTSALDSIEIPDIQEITLPDAPEYSLPTKPTLHQITLPPVPSFQTVAPFAGSLPTELAPPTIPTLNYTEEEYDSHLKDAAEAWLEDIILNGGTGLGATIEQGIFDRSLSREALVFQKNIEETTDKFAATGFPRPNGSLRAKIDRLHNDFQDRVEDINRQISETQATLAQQNSQFAITETIKLESVNMQLHSDAANRALDFAKALVSTHQAVYNLKVAEYSARVDAFKAEADVHKTLIEAVIAEVEQYKAQVDASEVSTKINDSLVNQYATEVSAVKSLADLYTAQMGGAKVEAEIQALGLERYKTEVEAARSSIDAKAKQLDVIKTRIQAQGVKIDAYKGEVEGIKSANDTEKLKVEVAKAQIEAKLAVNKNNADVYGQAIETFRAQVYAYTGELQSYESAQKVLLEIARKDSGDSKMAADIAIENNRVTLERTKANAELYNLQTRYEAEINVKELSARIDGAVSGMKHLSVVAAAALSQLNAIVQASTNTEVDDE